MRLFFLSLIFLAACGSSQKAGPETAGSATRHYVFVLSANSGSLSDGKLTLKHVPSVVYFSDAPNRIAGTMNLAQFASLLGKQNHPLAANLSILQLSPSLNVEFHVTTAKIVNGSVTFRVSNYKKGTIPDLFQQCSLFIEMELDKQIDQLVMQDYHPLDCSCGSGADECLELVSE